MQNTPNLDVNDFVVTEPDFGFLGPILDTPNLGVNDFVPDVAEPDIEIIQNVSNNFAK